ncbi:hypothetical protein NEISICOT_01260 [Neisseria sicca ATCC 29256]|uniref:Uncharacterized protein n=1 Tax=Neisseria sicca ATCC 29256 TaxID=547045 RepID=C6M417_NEISI|nr:hypothetical protein NEISICOT_01260 [Neisseria sicca ATCC 29256]
MFPCPRSSETDFRRPFIDTNLKKLFASHMNFNQTTPRTQAQSERLIPTPNPRHCPFHLQLDHPSRFPFTRRTQDNDKTETNNECYNK